MTYIPVALYKDIVFLEYTIEQSGSCQRRHPCIIGLSNLECKLSIGLNKRTQGTLSKDVPSSHLESKTLSLEFTVGKHIRVSSIRLSGTRIGHLCQKSKRRRKTGRNERKLHTDLISTKREDVN